MEHIDPRTRALLTTPNAPIAKPQAEALGSDINPGRLARASLVVRPRVAKRSFDGIERRLVAG